MHFIVTTLVFLFMTGSLTPLDDQKAERDNTENRSKFLEVVENLSGLDVSDPVFTEKCILLGDGDSSETGNSELLALIDYMSFASDESNTLLRIAQEKRATICLDDIIWNERGFFDFDLNFIVLKNSLTFSEKVLILVHELRHLDQYSRGFCPSTQFDISEHVRLTYALEADAQAITTLSAWIMRENGYTDPWNALKGFVNYEDIPDSFSISFLENQNLSIATNAAFAQWYHSAWRLESYYVSACTSYLDDLDRSKMIQSYGKLPDSFFDSLCSLPDGSNYECLKNPEIDFIGPFDE